MKKSSKKYFGFTLVELIIVITILAILATVAFVSFQNYTSQTRDTKRLSDLSQISKGVEVFQVGAGSVPTPDNPKTLTGGNSTLLVGKINSKVLKSLSNNVLDPVSGTEYTYATIGNGKYYQIGADSENLITSIFQNTFADAKSSIVKGNYLFDPSLPSLIISSGSNLYDPNNCFVINGGTNLVSNNTNCTSKANTSLKSFDSSLVGYWDMESLTGTMLKDLSGNGYDASFSGLIMASAVITRGTGVYNSGNAITNFSPPIPGIINSYNSKGVSFSGGFLYIPLDTRLSNIDSATDDITITSICETDGIIDDNFGNEFGNLIIKQSPIFSTYRYNLFSSNGFFMAGNGGDTNRGTDINASMKENLSFDSKYALITFKKEKNIVSFYINGLLINKVIRTIPLSTGYPLYGLYIGATKHGSGPSLTRFIGTIDEIKFYNRALSDEEISSQAKIAGF